MRTYLYYHFLDRNMAKKDILLDEICEGILKDWRKSPDFNFSGWIRSKMLDEYNSGQPKLATKQHRQGLPPQRIHLS